MRLSCSTTLQGLRSEGVVTEVVGGGLRWMFGIGAVIMPGFAGSASACERDRPAPARPICRMRSRRMGVAFRGGTDLAHLAVLPHRDGMSPNSEHPHPRRLASASALMWVVAPGLSVDFGSVAIIALVAFSIVALLLFTEVSLSQCRQRARPSGVAAAPPAPWSSRRTTLWLARPRQERAGSPEFFDEEPPPRRSPGASCGAADGQSIVDSQGLGPAHCNGVARDDVLGDLGEANGRIERQSPFLPLDRCCSSDAADSRRRCWKPFNRSPTRNPTIRPRHNRRHRSPRRPRIEIIDTAAAYRSSDAAAINARTPLRCRLNQRTNDAHRGARSPGAGDAGTGAAARPAAEGSPPPLRRRPAYCPNTSTTRCARSTRPSWPT